METKTKKTWLASLVSNEHLQLSINKFDELESSVDAKLSLAILSKDAKRFSEELQELLDKYLI